MLISLMRDNGRFTSIFSAVFGYIVPSSLLKSLSSALLTPLMITSLKSTINRLFGRFLRNPKMQKALVRCTLRGQAEIWVSDVVAYVTLDLLSPTTQMRISMNS